MDMPLLPDFGLANNGNKNPKRFNLPVTEKFQEIHNKLVQEDLHGIDFEKSCDVAIVSRHKTRKRSLTDFCKTHFIDEELEMLISKIFLEFGTNISNAQRRIEILKIVVTHWGSHEEYYRSKKPSEYINIIYGHVILSGSQCLWKSKKSLSNEFSIKSLPQRRIELILSGIDRPTAEKYLRWQANLFPWFLFPELDINIFQTNQVWNDEIADQELIKFVSRQNGLFQNIDFTDWYVETNSEELRKFHPEEIRQRFKSRYHRNVDNLNKYIPLVEIQKELENVTKILKIKKKFSNFGMDWASISKFMKQTNFMGQNFKCWISLSSFIGMETSTVVIRKLIRKYLSTLNPVKEKALLSASGDDDKWCKLFEKDHHLLCGVIESTAYALLNDLQQWNHMPPLTKKFPSGEDLCVTQVCKDSITRILHLFTKSKELSELVGVDLIVFQVAKYWENAAKQKNRGNPFLRVEDGIRGNNSNKVISEEDIIGALEPDEVEEMDDDWDMVIENKPEEKQTSYSKKFCFRKLSDAEWKLIIQAVYLAGTWSEVDFDISDTWRDIVTASGISTGKSPEYIKAQFMETIFPRLDTFCSEEICSSVYEMIKPHK